ncbi:MAG: hypothetical protein M3033_01065, partial [Acidobacteriota bacterium]|nr:hypothetical protein [Acidobacteriota bacterium]
MNYTKFLTTSKNITVKIICFILFILFVLPFANRRVGFHCTDDCFEFDSLKFPLEASTIIFTIALAATFALWYFNEGTLSIHSIFTTKR